MGPYLGVVPVFASLTLAVILRLLGLLLAAQSIQSILSGMRSLIATGV